jgi:hypothetical protein
MPAAVFRRLNSGMKAPPALQPVEDYVPLHIPQFAESGWTLELSTSDIAARRKVINAERDFELAGRSLVLFREA